MKTKYFFVFSVLVSSLFSSALRATQETSTKCELNKNLIKADYTITSSRQNNISNVKYLTLYRKENRVAHQYPQTEITESWFLTSNKRIMPVRFFEAHGRAIEYSPTETVHGKKETDWSLRNQLISDKLLARMEKVDEKGQGCNIRQRYELKNSHTSLTLIWDPNLLLVTSFEQQRGNVSQQWTLKKVSGAAKDIEPFLAQLDTFQTTDYADIGDDHTDPFLTKMVTLGFIEPGSSGFYNEHGQALEGQHQHH